MKVWYVPELNVILTPPLNQGFTKLGTRRRSLAGESARRTIPAAQPCSEKRGEIGAREAAVDNFDCYLMIPDVTSTSLEGQHNACGAFGHNRLGNVQEDVFHFITAITRPIERLCQK